MLILEGCIGFTGKIVVISWDISVVWRECLSSMNLTLIVPTTVLHITMTSFTCRAWPETVLHWKCALFSVQNNWKEYIHAWPTQCLLTTPVIHVQSRPVNWTTTRKKIESGSFIQIGPIILAVILAYVKGSDFAQCTGPINRRVPNNWPRLWM